MSIQIQCTRCHHKYAVSDRTEGRKVRCKHCDAVFIAQRLTDTEDTAVALPGVEDTGVEDTGVEDTGVPDEWAEPSDSHTSEETRTGADGVAAPHPAPASIDQSLSFDQFLLHFGARPLPGKSWLILLILALSALAFTIPTLASIGVTVLVVAGLALVVLALASFIVPIAIEAEKTHKPLFPLMLRYRRRARRGVARIIGGILLLVGSMLIFRVANIGQAIRDAGWQFPQSYDQWTDAWAGRPLSAPSDVASTATAVDQPPLFPAPAPADAPTDPDDPISLTTRPDALASTPPPVGVATTDTPLDEGQAPLLGVSTSPDHPAPPAPSVEPRATVTILSDHPTASRGLATVQRALSLHRAERIVYATPNGSFALLARVDGAEQVLRRLDLRHMGIDAEMHLPAVEMRHLALAPDGNLVLRRIEQPAPGIDVLSLDEGRLLRTIPADDPGAVVSIIGFISPTEFLLHSHAAARSILAWVDASTGRTSREMRLPLSGAGQVHIAPDGRFMLVAPGPGADPVLELWELSTPARRRMMISLPAGTRLEDRNLAFSADGNRVALLLEQARSLELYVVALPEGKTIARHTLPSIHGTLPYASTHRGRWVTWVEGDRGLLLFGAAVLEPTTGRVIGRLGIDLPVTQHVLEDQQIAIEHGRSDQHEIVLARLDPALGDQLSAASQSEPLLLSAPDLPNPGWVTRTARSLSDDGPLSARPEIDPAPSPTSKLLDRPIPLPAPAQRIGAVMFTGAELPRALVHVAPARIGGFWDGADPRTTVHGYDLRTGAEQGAMQLPPGCRLLGASPDGELLLTGLPGSRAGASHDPGARDHPGSLRERTTSDESTGVQRLDIWSLSDRRHIGGFEPYLEAPAVERTLVYASMPDRDGILTLNSGGVLIRWSLKDKRALWGWHDVSGTPLLTPGGKMLLIQVGQRMRVIDARSGQGRFDLEALPGDAGTLEGGAFSTDGRQLVRGSQRGAVLWNMVQGRIASILPVPASSLLQFLDDRHLLIDQRVFAINARGALLSCTVEDGRHLYQSPDRRHWYLANSADGHANLCAVTLPPASRGHSDAESAPPPSLLAPGAPVNVEANVDTFSIAMRDRLEHRLKEQGNKLSPSAPITLRAQATLVKKPGEVVISENGTSTSISYAVFRCQLSVVTPDGKTLWRGIVTEVQPPEVLAPPARSGETLSERYHRGLVEAALAWAEKTPFPDYVAPEGIQDRVPHYRLTARMEARIDASADAD